MKTITRLQCGLVLLFAFPGAAHAINYNVTFCVLLDHDFDDAAPGMTPGDDYENSNSYLTWARGIKVRVRRVGGGFDEWAMADWGGSTPGCSGPWSLSSFFSYNITVYSQALADDDSEIFVYDDHASPAVYGYTVSSYHPTASTTEYIIPTAADHWNILAASTWALYRSNGGVVVHDFEFLTEECQIGATSCWDGTDPGGSCRCGGYLYIEPTSSGDMGAGRRYVIVHEMGHDVAAAIDGANASKNYGATYDHYCDTSTVSGHKMMSKEYHSAAAVEGIAHYYAAVAFNNTTESDCEFEYYKETDWNTDNDEDDEHEELDPVAEANCNGAPYTGGPALDFIGNNCTGTNTSRAVEYDYLRFFWDLTHEEGVSTETLFAIWDGADPYDWCAYQFGAYYHCSSASYLPTNRLRSAAIAEDIDGDTWDYWAEANGVQH